MTPLRRTKTPLRRAVLAGLVVAALATSTAGCSDRRALGARDARAQVAPGPPPLVLRTGGERVELPAWSWCYTSPVRGDAVPTSACADGPAPKHPPLVSGGERATFDFPLDGWAFTADFRPAGRRPGQCHPEWSAPVRRDADGYEVPAAAPAGTWDVDVFGRAGSDDLVATFRWRTTGPAVPVPFTATVSFLGPPDLGTPMTAPAPTVRLTGVRPEPDEISARLVVDASGGERLVFVLEKGHDDCDLDGAVTLVTPTGGGEIRIAGAPPFTYGLDLTLDGVAHAASGTWPENLVANGNELALTLRR